MKLHEFLNNLINKFNDNDIRYCILRNYKDLPYENNGNDIDFLIDAVQLKSSIRVLTEISGVVVTKIAYRPYVTSVFIFNVEWGRESSIQVDLFTSLSWKGIAFASTNEVLESAQPIFGKHPIIKKPYPVHEVIISFFSSYLIGGWIKSKYQKFVIEVFMDSKAETMVHLTKLLGLNLAEKLYSNIINDDRTELLRLLFPIKNHLFKTSLRNNFLKTIVGFANYYWVEIKMRYTPHPIDAVCILGADGAGKSAVIHEVNKNLTNSTKGIDTKHLVPKLCSNNITPKKVEDPHGLKPRGKVFSMGKLAYWLSLYWANCFFHGYKNVTLVIWDRYYYDVLVDPRRYRYGASMVFARFVSRLIPKLDLVILLDASADVLQQRKQEVPYEETARQRDAYLKIVQAMDNGVVIDSSQPLNKVVSDVTEVIIEKMASKTKKNLGL